MSGVGLFVFLEEKSTMSRQEKEYRKMLQALMDSRTVVLSLLSQLQISNLKEQVLNEIVRKCALDLVQRKPIIRAALCPRIRHARRTKTTKRFDGVKKSPLCERDSLRYRPPPNACGRCRA